MRAGEEMNAPRHGFMQCLQSPLSGKGVVVFGAASGMGAATARHLAELGAQVWMSDLGEERLAHAAGSSGPISGVTSADVADEAQVRRVFAQMGDRIGRIDGVVTTAGVLHGERILHRDGAHALAQFERVVRVNLTGTFNVMRLGAEAMARNDPGEDGERGVVVNTASVSAYEGQIGQVAYAASKAGVAGMTLPAARDLARHGIRVVAIAPGLFLTPMVAGMGDEARRALERTVPFPSRSGKPDEYAALVAHVLQNRMINGEVIRIDGALRMAER